MTEYQSSSRSSCNYSHFTGANLVAFLRESAGEFVDDLTHDLYNPTTTFSSNLTRSDFNVNSSFLLVSTAYLSGASRNTFCFWYFSWPAVLNRFLVLRVPEDTEYAKPQYIYFGSTISQRSSNIRFVILPRTWVLRTWGYWNKSLNIPRSATTGLSRPLCIVPYVTQRAPGWTLTPRCRAGGERWIGHCYSPAVCWGDTPSLRD